MKILSKKFSKGGEGTLVILPQTDEDMWHLYNLIAEEDTLSAVTFRKVQKVGNTGSVKTDVLKLKLTLAIDKIEYDETTCMLRVSGKNIKESDHIKMGQYHTIELDKHRNFTIWKQEWDAMHIERLEQACNPSLTAEIAAVVLQPGLAHVCILSKHMTIVRAKIEISIPKKRALNNNHNKAVTRFFSAIMEAVLRYMDLDVLKVVLLASPGFLKDDLKEYLEAEAVRQDVKPLLENKHKFVACHAASGYKHALKDVLADPDVAARISDTKSFMEVRALTQFFDMLNNDPDRALYGYRHVTAALSQAAVATLLCVDSLFQSSDRKTRAKHVRLVEEAKETGAEVYIFSAMHVSGEQLNQLGGVACVLRFPLPEVANEMFSDEDDSSDDESPLDAKTN